MYICNLEYLIYDSATSVYDLTGVFSGAVTDPELYMFINGGSNSVLSLPTLNYLKELECLNQFHL